MKYGEQYKIKIKNRSVGCPEPIPYSSTTRCSECRKVEEKYNTEVTGRTERCLLLSRQHFLAVAELTSNECFYRKTNDNSSTNSTVAHPVSVLSQSLFTSHGTELFSEVIYVLTMSYFHGSLSSFPSIENRRLGASEPVCCYFIIFDNFDWKSSVEENNKKQTLLV